MVIETAPDAGTNGSPPRRWAPLPTRRQTQTPDDGQLPGQVGLSEVVEQLPLRLLDPAHDNPRRVVDVDDGFVESVRQQGILQPLVVTPGSADGRYLVVFGHRRRLGAIRAGLLTAPCIVRHMTEEQRKAQMLVENLKRADLTPLDEALAFGSLRDELGWSQRQIAAKVGCTQPHVSHRLALLVLPPVARSYLDAGTITAKEGLEITRLATIPGWEGVPLERVLTAARGESGRSVKEAVQAELDAVERAEQVRTRGHELLAQGVTVLAWPADESVPRRERKLFQVDDWSAWPGEALEVDVEAHRREPCHAAAIDPRRAKVTWLCTDPGRHAVRDSAAADRRARRQQIAQQRAAFASHALADKGNREALLRRGLQDRIEAASASVLAMACELLGLEPAELVDPEPAGSGYRAALRSAAATRGGLERVGATLEAARDVLAENPDMLQQLGYQPGPDEMRQPDPQDVEGL